MADADENAAAPDAVPRTITAADLEPGTPAWRVNVAMCAHQFFGIVHDPEVAAAIGKAAPPNETPNADPSKTDPGPAKSKGGPPKTVPFDPWSIADFSRYLHTLGLPAAGDAVTITHLLSAMERAGLLLPVGWHPQLPILGQRYIAQGAISKGQRGGNLWLSKVFGAELIIPSYNAVTIQLTGNDADGNPVERTGTGLVLDHTHIVTNKHVVTGLAGSSSELAIYPSSDRLDAEQINCAGVAKPHPDVDVAVIDFQMPEGKGLPRLGGMAFRDPDWADEVYVFGYPRVPMTAEMAITVQRGEVVNPATTTIPDRQRIFLYSAIARPGNSGGPIVAQDGRVIGLVVEDSSPSTSARAAGHRERRPRWLWERINHLDREVEELKPKVAAPPFYRGIPSSEVIRALDDLGYGGIATMDLPAYSPSPTGAHPAPPR